MSRRNTKDQNQARNQAGCVPAPPVAPHGDGVSIEPQAPAESGIPAVVNHGGTKYGNAQAKTGS
jgi:hypothetical protein